MSFPHAIADFNELLHDVEEIAVPFARAEGVVEGFVYGVKLAVNGVRFRIGFVFLGFEASHRFLRGGVVFIHASHYRRALSSRNWSSFV